MVGEDGRGRELEGDVEGVHTKKRQVGGKRRGIEEGGGARRSEETGLLEWIQEYLCPTLHTGLDWSSVHC